MNNREEKLIGPDTHKKRLRRSIIFCDMFIYESEFERSIPIDQAIPRAFNTFAKTHLIFTMFIVDKSNESMGGFIYPLLKELDKAHLCDEVKEVLETKVDSEEFRDFLSKIRSKMATHGDLTPASLPENIQRLLLSDDHFAELNRLIGELETAVRDLRNSLQKEWERMA